MSKSQMKVKEAIEQSSKKMVEDRKNRFDPDEGDKGRPDGLEIELKDLYAPNGSYAPEQKIAAVMAYMVTGTSKKASALCNVPPPTIRWWKNESSWWHDVLVECRRRKQDELDAAFTNVIHTGIELLEDRMVHGDKKLDKEGNVVSVPMSGRDLAVSLAVIFDKRQLARGEATSRTERVSELDRLEHLQKKFEEMASQLNAKTIEGSSKRIIEEEITQEAE